MDFLPTSPWNARPTAPVLIGEPIPESPMTPPWSPMVAADAGSTGVYQGNVLIEVQGPAAGTKLFNQRTNQWIDSIRIRASADVSGAPDGDGHCIVIFGDQVYDFYQFKHVDGVYRAKSFATGAYSYGTGFGNATVKRVGTRAAGCSMLGGLIRTSEIGLDVIPHALAISIGTYAAKRGFIAPATDEDDARSIYTGDFPIGARMMLPATFNVDALKAAGLKTVARTLMSEGAIIVDTNTGVPLMFFAQRGSGFAFDWRQQPDFELIRLALRRVMS